MRKKEMIAEAEALRDEEGMIHAPKVVQWARRNRRSAWHEHLLWDDKEAGERYRIDQVRQFIQVHISDPVGFRRYVSLSIDRKAGGGYRPVSEVLSRQDLKAIMLDDALDDLNRLRRLYVSLRELQPIWDCIDRLRPRKAA